jgi:hypothetical protein
LSRQHEAIEARERYAGAVAVSMKRVADVMVCVKLRGMLPGGRESVLADELHHEASRITFPSIATVNSSCVPSAVPTGFQKKYQSGPLSS